MDSHGLLALSVVGPRGMVDLLVPGETTARDVTAEYARQTGHSSPLSLRVGLGGSVSPGASMLDAAVVAGDLLVAAEQEPETGRGAGPAPSASSLPSTPVTAGAWLWVAVAVATAAVAGWHAARLPADARTVVANMLLLGVVVGVLPGGRLALPRGVAAPAFGAAAAYAVLWRPDPLSLPVTLGLVGLVAALTAAAARMTLPDQVSQTGAERRDEAHLAWMAAGGLLFAVAAVVAVLGLPATVAWSVLLVVAMLGARLIPALAVDVPDELLVDLERLAVTAWSAREEPGGRRGMVVTRRTVALLARRGQRLVVSAATAIAVVTPTVAHLLLAADLPALDRLGATALVVCVGGSLLLVANSHRDLVARLLLRVGGLLCWLAVVLAAPLTGPTMLTVPATAQAMMPVTAAAVAVGGICILTAVATGRGWRSVWWARRAEVAEAVAGALAIGAACIATGLFRLVWELASRYAA